jgi:hypothetical protein
VLAHGWNATAYQLLNPGIRRWFAPPPLQGVIGWVAAAGFRVVAGAPVCSDDDLPAVVGAFEGEARRGGDAFKAKLLPDDWEPVWAITSEPRVTLRTLYAIAGAFSGTSPVRFLARGTARALAQEARRLRRG